MKTPIQRIHKSVITLNKFSYDSENSSEAVCAQGLVCSHLVSAHPVAVKKADFLIFFPSHVVHTLIGLHISDLWMNPAVYYKNVQLCSII